MALAHRAASAARKAAEDQLEAEAEARLNGEARSAAAEAEIARLRALLEQKEG